MPLTKNNEAKPETPEIKVALMNAILTSLEFKRIVQLMLTREEFLYGFLNTNTTVRFNERLFHHYLYYLL